MSKKQAVKPDDTETTEEVKTSNIANLESLANEFKKGLMGDKKRIALRVKLIGLFKEGIITEDEQSLMEFILTFERGRGIINSRDEEILNGIEAALLEDLCEVKSDDAPVVHHLKKGMVCKFKYDPLFNDNRNKPDSIGRYFVYIPRVIPSQHQYSYEAALKLAHNQPVPDEMVPKARIKLLRVAFKKREFQQWFDVQDDSILNEAPKKIEEEYTF